MPKGRIKRRNKLEQTIYQMINERREGCVCLLNGLCLCVVKQPPSAPGAKTEEGPSVVTEEGLPSPDDIQQ